MSKAFTLFELIISLILFTFITSLLSKPLMDFYHLNFTALHTNNLITQAHLNLLKIEKLIQNCINITFVGGKIKCRKRKIKCRIFATNYLSFNLKLKL